jgi:endothelin-converting enzyme
MLILFFPAHFIIRFLRYRSTFTPHEIPDRIILTYPPYLTSLSKLFANTTDDVLEGYLVARASLSLAEHLGPGTEIWKANRELVEELTGIKKGAVGDRGEYCLGKVETALGFAAGR